MTSTALERRPGVALFPGATAGEIIAVASDVAAQFSDVVRKQKMSRRIGENDHIQIEAWQTIGALTGVLADEGVVNELPWPPIEPLGDEPPAPGREPRRESADWPAWKAADAARRAWELHRDLLRARAVGRAFGFKAEFRAAKGGVSAGWGEGRCTRTEASKVNQEDYALASMAQTRAQSRALGAPLKFVVKLAGYETTPAEELDGNAPSPPTAAAAPALPWGPVVDSDEQLEQAAELVRSIAAVPVDGAKFVMDMGAYFDGIPVACLKMLRGLHRTIAAARPQFVGPPDEDVYPPGHYQGD
jgi:hypothetical protein